MDSQPPAVSEIVRGLFQHREDPHEGADIHAQRRLTAVVLGLSSLLTLAFLPFEPVDDGIGLAGWPVAVLIALGGLAGAALLARRSPSFDQLLAVAYGGVAGVALLNYLAGGGSSAYEDLYVLWVGAGAPQPPRRALAHLGTMMAALALPLLYEGRSWAVVSDMAAEAAILAVIGLLTIVFIAGLRRQRAGLQAGAEVQRRLARLDSLTGLGNRRAFDEALTVAVARAARENAPLSLGLLVVDNLKRINDSHGHLEGDRLLAELARAFQQALRQGDGCFRWAGGEFLVVMPDTAHEQADAIMRDLADAASHVRAPGGRAPELAWGIAQLGAGAGAEDLLAAADLALLASKTDRRR